MEGPAAVTSLMMVQRRAEVFRGQKLEEALRLLCTLRHAAPACIG